MLLVRKKEIKKERKKENVFILRKDIMAKFDLNLTNYKGYASFPKAIEHYNLD